jgi:hypothetical protein
MFRYLALLWNAESAQALASAEDLERNIQAMSPRWSVVLKDAGVVVLVADRSQHLTAQALFGGRGIVLGEIFPRPNPLDDDAPAESAEFGAKETQAVIESQGRILVSRYWGNYVALILDANRAWRRALSIFLLGRLPRAGITI